MIYETQLQDTVRKQKEFIDSVLGANYTINITTDPDKIFWSSRILVHNEQPLDGFWMSSGKGTSLNGCLASNYGELIEKYSWSIYKNNLFNSKQKTIKLLNITTNKEETFDTENILEFKGKQDHVATGVDIHSARYHALCEAVEIGLIKNNYSFMPIENFIAIDTEEMFPELPKKIHDNFHIIIRKDPRIPLYNTIALKCPTEHDTVFMPLHIYKDNNIIKIQHTITDGSAFVGDTKNPWPAFGGTKTGLNLRSTIKSAISEMFQAHYLLKMENIIDKDIYFPETNNKKYPNYFKIKKANDFEDFKQDTIENNNNLILDSLRESGYNVWELDITPLNSSIKVIKIITDYTISCDNPFSKKVLSSFFKF